MHSPVVGFQLGCLRDDVDGVSTRVGMKLGMLFPDLQCR